MHQRIQLRRNMMSIRRWLSIEILEERRVLSGVTLMTHGFNSSADTWVAEMAQAIAERPDISMDQALYRLEVTDPGHDGGPLSVTSSKLSGPIPTDDATQFPEISLLLDWSDVAGTLTAGYTRSTYDVAAAVADSLFTEGFLSDLGLPLAALPFHLMGHSRGASLVGELAHQLGTKGVWVDQVTTHDPHPVDGVDEPGGANYGDAPMIAWDNVTFWDNYWRPGANSLFDFSGEPVADTHNVELSNDVLESGGYGLFSGGSHSDVHLWYHGTIDLIDPANDGSQTVPSDWYGGVHPERDASGYFFSRLVNGTRPAAGLADDFAGGSANRQAVTVDDLAWPNVLQLEMTAADATFTSGQTIPLTYYHYDADSQATVTFSLDQDRNPFNSNQHDLESTIVLSSAAPVLSNASPVVSGVNSGIYYVLATIGDVDGQFRYAYASTAVTVNAQLPNSPPLSASDAYTVASGETLVASDFDGSVGGANDDGVLVNDSDPDGDPIVAQLVDDVAYGTLTLNDDGTFVYMHDGGPETHDEFTYRAFDGEANSALTTVAISIIPAVVDDRAQGETSIQGTVTEGDFTATFASDDVIEVLTEVQLAKGKPSNRRSFLEHQWSFQVTGGSTLQFHVEAYRDANGDAFEFQYQDPATAAWIPLTTISKTTDDDQYQIAELPSLIAGSLEIRVVDTISAAGESQDSLYIDDMFIRSIAGAVPPSLSIDDVIVTEGDSGTVTADFTVTRSGDLSQTVSVDYMTVDGTATAGSDYAGIELATLEFGPDVSSLNVSIAVNGDIEEETDETFFVMLANPTGATLADDTGKATIMDDDASVVSPALFVYDIRFESKRGGRDYRAVAEIRSDSDGDGQATANDLPIAGVEVTIIFAGETYVGLTDTDGVVRTPWEKNLPSGSYYANVTDLALDGFTWDPLLDLEDDSDDEIGPDDLLLF